MIARSLIAVAAVALPLFAQEPQWVLPDDHALVYERTRRVETRAIEPPQKPDGPRPPALGIPGEFGAGVLLATDLESKRRALAREPLDLSELLPCLAFELRTWRSGRTRREFSWVKPFGRLLVTIDAKAPDEGGDQDLTCEIRRNLIEEADVPGKGRDRKDRSARWQRTYSHDLEATLTIHRHFDPLAGRVDSFTARLQAVVTVSDRPDWRSVGITLEEEWRFREEFIADSIAFRERVGNAIRKGRDRIAIELDNRISKFPAPPDAKDLHVDNAAGELALLTLTLIKADCPRDDPTLLDALETLRRRELHDTYSLGVTLMAFEAFYAEPNERQHLIEGLIDQPQKRMPIAGDLALMKDWVARLLDNRERAANGERLGCWSYTGNSGADHSNSQYALLGLFSAQLCGVDIAADVWIGAARHWVAAQCPTEGPATLSLLTYRQLAKARTRPTTTRTEVRGWSYRQPVDEPYGSMTAAGVASLILAQSALRDARVRDNDLLGNTGRAIRSGYAWLAQHLDVRSNPGRPPDHDYWRCYWLYGLERACELGQIARLGDRDWYFEGAALLLAMQRTDGNFEPATWVDDCFAILFLKKAQVPVATGGR